MARKKKTETEFEIKQLNIEEAKKQFNRKRSRGSKYDDILDAAEKLEVGKALIIENVSASEVTGVRNRFSSVFGEDWKIESTKTDKENNLYTLLIYQDGE